MVNGSWIRPALVGLAIAIPSLALPRSAFAVDDDERAGARAAAGEGLKAFEEKRYADAADLFSRAESVVHSPVHLLYVARCQAALGALVKAQETYRRLAREELAANAPAPFRKAVEDANSELKQLEPRLPYVTVTVPGHGESAVVEMDGKRIPPALVGVPRPVDPGTHQFKATASGMAKEASLTLKEGERQNVVLTLEAVQPAAAGAAPTAGPAGAQPATPAAAPAATPTPPPGGPTEPIDQGSGGGSMMKIAGWTGIGLGVVGGVVGTIFLLQRGSKAGDADDAFSTCNKPPTRYCSAAEKANIDQLDSDAKSAGTLAVVGYAVGGVGLVGGITLLLLAPKSGSAQNPSLSPWVGYNTAGLQGTF